jgi:hypothetical protein
MVVVETVVDVYGNIGFLVEYATLDNVLLCPLGKLICPSHKITAKGSIAELAKFMQKNKLKLIKVDDSNPAIATGAWQTAKVVGNDPVAAV